MGPFCEKRIVQEGGSDYKLPPSCSLVFLEIKIPCLTCMKSLPVTAVAAAFVLGSLVSCNSVHKPPKSPKLLTKAKAKHKPSHSRTAPAWSSNTRASSFLPATVDVAVATGDASPGVDYSWSPATLVFSAGDHRHSMRISMDDYLAATRPREVRVSA